MKKNRVLLFVLMHGALLFGSDHHAFTGLLPDSTALYPQKYTPKEIMGLLADDFASEVQDQVEQFSGSIQQFFGAVQSTLTAAQAQDIFEKYAQKQLQTLEYEIQALQTEVVSRYYIALQDEGYVISWDVLDQNIVTFKRDSDVVLGQGYQAIRDLLDTLYVKRMNDFIMMDLKNSKSQMEKDAFAQAQAYLKAHQSKPQSVEDELKQAAQTVAKQFVSKLADEMKKELKSKAKKAFGGLKEDLQKHVKASKQSMLDSLQSGGSDSQGQEPAVENQEPVEQPVAA